MTFKIAVVQFPGSNCERETKLAIERSGMQAVEFLWNESKEKLRDCAGFVIVGGFSYEDRSRAGAIAALDPIMQVIKEESLLGKPVLGICNGAQILVETGLVPGLENHKIGLALTDNMRIKDGKVLGTGFYNAWINMRLSDEYQLNAFTRCLKPKNILNVPVAHAEGRFVIPPALLTEMQVNGLNVFQYCNERGEIINEFPVNPNGSIDNIAAISNKAGNIMAMMPHPERTSNGDLIFQSMKEYIQEAHFVKTHSLHYLPRNADIKNYQQKNSQIIIDLIITDNSALTVENALKSADIPVNIKRHIHWEIECDSPQVLEKIKASGVLFNERKEKIIPPPSKQGVKSFLVRSKDDMIGKQKQQMLEDHFSIQGIKEIRHSVLWQVSATNNLEENVQAVINSHILFNPYAHDCYYY